MYFLQTNSTPVIPAGQFCGIIAQYAYACIAMCVYVYMYTETCMSSQLNLQYVYTVCVYVAAHTPCYHPSLHFLFDICCRYRPPWPSMTLQCDDPLAHITNITFADWGTPLGACGYGWRRDPECSSDWHNTSSSNTSSSKSSNSSENK